MIELPPGGLSEAKDEGTRAALIEYGRLLFTKPCNFFFAAQKLEQLPPVGLPEVAFCGRSNVGKSSLINALCNHKALARVSNTPGRTKQLNFFELGERLVLVDMPGYGYAQAAKEVKEDWQGLMFNYLRGRPTLRRVFLLMDARIETKPADTMAMQLLNEAAVSFQIVLTKSDDTKPAWLAQRFEAVSKLARRHTAGHPLVLVTSSEEKSGLEEVRAEMAILGDPPAA
jgi:GTP-binding protein